MTLINAFNYNPFEQDKCFKTLEIDASNSMKKERKPETKKNS